MSDVKPEELGLLIGAMQARKGLNQTEFGDLLGVRQNTVSKWRRRRSIPRLPVLITMWSLAEGLEADLLRSFISDQFHVDVVQQSRSIILPKSGDEGRFERAIRAIQCSKLTGGEFIDWVQAVCDDAVDGYEAECESCGGAVHEGACPADPAPVDPATAAPEVVLH